MKPSFITLLALCLCLGGCGKKEAKQTAKEPPKTKKPPPIKPGTVLWEFETGRWVDSSPAIGSDGTVYVGSGDNKLYAIKTDSKGLAKSPWPMRGQNARHMGQSVAGSIAKSLPWTFGVGQRDLAAWKGQSAQNVMKVFGKPDVTSPYGQNGGAWLYKGMNITDANGKRHTSALFIILNGTVAEIQLGVSP